MANQSTAGVCAQDLDAVINRSKGILNQMEELDKAITTFVSDVQELESVGPNIEKLKPAFESLQKEVRDMQANNKDMFVTFIGKCQKEKEIGETRIAMD